MYILVIFQEIWGYVTKVWLQSSSEARSQNFGLQRSRVAQSRHRGVEGHLLPLSGSHLIEGAYWSWW